MKTFQSRKRRFQSLAYAPNGRFLAGGCDTGEVILWFTANGIETAAFQTAGSIRPAAQVREVCQIAFSPNGNLLAAAGCHYAAPAISLFDVPSGRLINDRCPFRNVSSVAFCPSGHRMAFSERAKGRLLERDPISEATLEEWDAATQLQSGSGQKLSTTGMAFSPNGNYLACGSNGSSFSLVDLSTHKELLTRKLSGYYFYRIAFLSDAMLAVAAGRSVTLFEVPSGKKRGAMIHHRTRMQDMAVSPDGSYIATVGREGQLVLWKGWTLQEHSRYDLGQGSLTAVAFSPDNCTVAAASDRGTITILDLDL